MAIKFICDGCDAVVEKPIELGIVIKRQYCDTCAEVVKEYTVERDKLHDGVAKQWADGVAKLNSEYEHAIGVLPDVT